MSDAEPSIIVCVHLQLLQFSFAPTSAVIDVLSNKPPVSAAEIELQSHLRIRRYGLCTHSGDEPT